MEQKSWLDATPSRTAFYFGLVLGVGASALVGLILLMSMSVQGMKLGGPAGVNGNNPTPSAAVPQQPEQPTGPVTITLNSNDHTMGPKNAKVTVVEYSDFQCPFCSRFKPTVDQMLKEYGNKIQFVYRHFPLDSIHPNARPAAVASECAAEQGKFFPYHDALFAKQETLGDQMYQDTAKSLGLDMSKFNDCLKSDRPAKKVEADYQAGLQHGVQGTPATFINGMAVSGAQPYAVLKSAIDAALAK